MTEKKTKINTPEITFSLRKIDTKYFNLRSPLREFDKSQSEIIRYHLNLGFPGSSPEGNLSLFVKVVAEIIETEEVVCEILTEFMYHIVSFNKKPITDLNEIKLPFDVVTTFVSIAISTIRGILIERSRGTILEYQFMPLFNPTKLAENLKLSKENPFVAENKNKKSKVT